ncbi:MAG: DUF4358 domain-containing protein [Oscillospiraceae bacterium]
MKKIIALALALTLSLSVFTACGGNDEKATYDVKEVLTKIDAAVPVTMPQDMTEETLTIMMGLDMADVKSYAGKITKVNMSADQIIVIEAQDGKIDVIKAAMEKMRDSVAKSFELYLPAQFEKATAGRVVIKGNYAVLAIVGDDVAIADSGVEKAYEAVDKAIDEAFK